MSVFDLWLPILLAGLATHVISTICWTALPHHKPEWQKIPAEDELLDWLVAKGVAPGQYIFPCTHDGKEAQCAEFKLKEAKGRGMIVLWDAPVHMGKAILQTLVFFMVAAFVIGYLASLALKPGAEFVKVFQFVMTAGVLTYLFGRYPCVFWFKRRMLMENIDSIAFALATGLIFASMWPK